MCLAPLPHTANYHRCPRQPGPTPADRLTSHILSLARVRSSRDTQQTTLFSRDGHSLAFSMHTTLEPRWPTNNIRHGALPPDPLPHIKGSPSSAHASRCPPHPMHAPPQPPNTGTAQACRPPRDQMDTWQGKLAPIAHIAMLIAQSPQSPTALVAATRLTHSLETHAARSRAALAAQQKHMPKRNRHGLPHKRARLSSRGARLKRHRRGRRTACCSTG